MKAKTKGRSRRDQDLHLVLEREWKYWPHDRRWVLLWRGRHEGSAHSQRDAIQIGREIASEKKCDLVVHGRDGKIKSKNSYGHDPRRRKG